MRSCMKEQKALVVDFDEAEEATNKLLNEGWLVKSISIEHVATSAGGLTGGCSDLFGRLFILFERDRDKGEE